MQICLKAHISHNNWMNPRNIISVQICELFRIEFWNMIFIWNQNQKLHLHVSYHPGKRVQSFQSPSRRSSSRMAAPGQRLKSPIELLRMTKRLIWLKIYPAKWKNNLIKQFVATVCAYVCAFDNRLQRNMTPQVRVFKLITLERTESPRRRLKLMNAKFIKHPKVRKHTI